MPVATNCNIASSGNLYGWAHIYCDSVCKQLLRKLKKIVLYSEINVAFKKEAPYSNLNDTELASFANGMCVLPMKKFPKKFLINFMLLLKVRTASVNITRVTK